VYKDGAVTVAVVDKEKGVLETGWVEKKQDKLGFVHFKVLLRESRRVAVRQCAGSGPAEVVCLGPDQKRGRPDRAPGAGCAEDQGAVAKAYYRVAWSRREGMSF